MAAPAAQAPTFLAALEYARRGWATLPLHVPLPNGGCSCPKPTCSRSAGKHPRIEEWQNNASKDEAVITGWWRAWPDSNVGIATGKPSGLIVLDVDPDSGGDESLLALEGANGILPRTQLSRTGSGGKHFLFEYPGVHVKNSAKKIAPGLDIRGDGGQIVAPPSLHRSGKSYRWLLECDLARAPAWLLDLLREEPRTPVGPPPPRRGPTDVLERCRRYIARMPPAIEGSYGSGALFAVALVAIRGFMLTTDEAYSLIASDYNPRCIPEWSERELRHKISDAFTKSTLPWGYILDKDAPPKKRKDIGDDDGSDTPAIELPFKLEDVGVGEFFATAEDKIQWVMEPFIPKGAFVLVQGGPKSGKTWFGAWLAAECAKMGLRVAVVEEEGPKEVLRDRLKPFLPDPIAVNRNLRVLYKKRIRLDNEKILRALIELYRGFDVIVLDPFVRLHGRKEKESDEMMIVLACVQKLMAETGAAVVLIHHTKKNESWQRSRSADAGLDDGRGSGTIASEADNVIAIRGVPPDERRAGQVRFIVENPGSRVGAEFDKRTAVIDLAEQAQAPFTWAGSGDASAGDTAEDEICEIVDLIIDSKKLPDTEKKAISGSAIAKTMKRNKKACLEAVRRLVRHGVLESVEGRFGPLYFRPETVNDAP